MKYLQNQRGFSLIEIMVALVLGFTLVMAFTGALIVGLQTEVSMDERLKITRYVDSIIEDLRNKSLSGVEETELEEIIEDILKERELEEKFTITVGEEEINKLYSVKISWTEGNYSKETLVSVDSE